ncbi:MAG TPA: YchJ family metal-binding protein [Rhabdochlamydiaceae bacterium]|nr:YchJ family metal-binding protein [Rhabdochlamydiaceae bacterium]
MKKLCPCFSDIPYSECCKRYHDGSLAENALVLMRSRYSAYALHLADYIIKTTHPSNSGFSSDIKEWKKDILQFSQTTQFNGLKISEFTDGDSSAYVTFTAYLSQGNQDVSFTERSSFVKEGDKWFYKSGVIEK